MIAVPATFTGPNSVHCAPVGDGHQPSRRRTIGWLVFCRILPNDDVDVLDHFLAEIPVNDNSLNQSQYPSGRTAVKLAEGLMVTLCREQQQLDKNFPSLLGLEWNILGSEVVHNAFRYWDRRPLKVAELA